MNQIFLLSFFIIGMVSFICLIVILAVFWRLLKLQFKYWLLAKKGFHKIEHIGEDRVMRTYLLRPKDTFFDIEGGMYFIQNDSLLKSSRNILKNVKDLDSKDDKIASSAEDKEIKDLLKQVSKLKYNTDAVFMQWGIPTLIYFGTDVNPINPAERKKIYDSKVMTSYVKRLLLEKEWKLVRLVMLMCIIGYVVTLIAGLLYWASINSSSNNLLNCQAMLNASQTQIFNYLNVTGQSVAQGSVITV